MYDTSPHEFMKGSVHMVGSRSVFFEKLNDRQFGIHIDMRTGDLLALRFFLPPATVHRCSSDHVLVNT